MLNGGTRGLDPHTASVLCIDLEVADLFEQVVRRTDPVVAAAWIKGELRRVLNYRGVRLSETAITADEVVEVLELFRDGTITDATANRLFEWLAAEPRSIRQLVGRLGMGRIAGEDELAALARRAVEESPKAVDDYLAGRANAMDFLVGRVMRASGGKADPKLTRAALEHILGAERLRRAGWGERFKVRYSRHVIEQGVPCHRRRLRRRTFSRACTRWWGTPRPWTRAGRERGLSAGRPL